MQLHLLRELNPEMITHQWASLWISERTPCPVERLGGDLPPSNLRRSCLRERESDRTTATLTHLIVDLQEGHFDLIRPVHPQLHLLKQLVQGSGDDAPAGVLLRLP